MAEQCKYHFGPGAAYATIKGCPFCWQDRAIVAEAKAADADVLRVENDRLRAALKWYGESGNFRHMDCYGELLDNDIWERANSALAGASNVVVALAGPGEGE